MGTRAKNKELVALTPIKEPTLYDLSASVADVVKLLSSLHTKFDVISANLNKTVKDVNFLSSSLNNIEQHSCSHSIKIFNLPLDEQVGKQSTTLAKHLHKVIFKPILALAIDGKFLDNIPSVFDRIDTAHLPPAKGKTPPIHVRLRSKIFKEAIMRNKKTQRLRRCYLMTSPR